MKLAERRASSTATLALIAVSVSLTALAGVALAKAPGATYCYNGVCHRVKTAGEMRVLVGSEEVVTASYYDDCKVDPHNPCTPLSSGEVFRPDLPDNAASPVYPNGTVLTLVNPKTEAKAVVRVNNSGPYMKGRMLDVSRAAAEQLGFLDAGVAKLKVTVTSGPPG